MTTERTTRMTEQIQSKEGGMARWTMKELDEISDKEFILHVLLERNARCTNYYSPLAEYIKKLMGRVDRQCPDNFTERTDPLNCPKCGNRRSRVNYIIDQVCDQCWEKQTNDNDDQQRI